MVNASILASVIFVLLSPIYRLAQKLIWRFTGVQEARARASREECYARSVHVQHVIWRNRFSHLTACDTSVFWTTHERFDHPKILLDPTISLYGITPTEVFFLKTDTNVDIYSSDTHPFMKWAQSNNAETVYVMPFEAFHRFADEVGDPKHTVIWLSSTGRCGSTVLSQVLEKVPGTITLGEPDAITTLAILGKAEKITKEDTKRRMRSIVRLQCKTIPGVQRIVVKLTGTCFEGVGSVHELFPCFYHIFMYRDMIPFIVSTMSLLEGEMSMRLIKYLLTSEFWSGIIEIRKYMYRNAFRLDRDDHKLDAIVNSLALPSIFAGFAAAVFQRYNELYRNSVPLHAVLYEDLLIDKKGMVRAIFKILEIPEKHVENALTAFEKDSQRGSTISKKSTGKRQPLSPRDIADADKVLDMYGFSNCNERIDLPGRILPVLK